MNQGASPQVVDQSTGPTSVVMDFKHLDDPGVHIRDGKRRCDFEDLKVGECDTAEESIVQRWSWAFERIWYGGHIYIMSTAMLNILLCLTRQVLKPKPRLFYRSTFAVTFLTYLLSLLQNLNGASPGFYALLPLETFQYMCVSLLWMFTIPHTIKLIPFALYSLLHVADTASEHHSSSKRRAKIAQGLSDKLAPRVINIMGYLDMWMLVELVRDCLLIRPGAVVSLIVFSFFFRVKLLYSASTLDAFMNCYHTLDRYLVRPSTPKTIRELWIRLRNKVETSELRTSKLHKEDTENAITKANLFDSLH